MVLLSLAEGTSIVTENVFENRFVVVDELNRLGAGITTSGHHAVVAGPRALSGSVVEAPDLRGGAALVSPASSPRAAPRSGRCTTSTAATKTWVASSRASARTWSVAAAGRPLDESSRTRVVACPTIVADGSA